MKKIQKPIGVFLSLIMLFTLFNAAVLAEDVSPVTTETVTYIDENGETQTVEAIVAVPGTHYASAETGWYVIEGTYSGSEALYFEDAVTNLILADDADWTVTNTDLVSIGNVNYGGGALNVYTQANDSAELHLSGGMICYNGAMNVYGGTIISSQRIGGSPSTGDFTAWNSTLAGSIYGKDVTFHNCTVTGKTGSITGDFTLDGGSYTSVCGSTEAPVRAASIVITNATVEGSGGQNGLQANGGSVTISNSTVNVSASNMAVMGSDVTISGGSVTATASGNFGIYSSGLIEVTGGAVTARGGTFGLYGQAGVVLTGGNVTASGNVAGVNAGSALTLGADDPGSSYTLGSVLSGATVTVQEGRTLTDGENEYSGTLTAEQVAALAGKTLVGAASNYYTFVPAAAPTATENGNIDYYESPDGKLYVKENGEYAEVTEKDVLVPYFEFADEGTQLSGYNGLDAEIVIPETIPDNYPDEALRGKSFGVIKDYAFDGNTVITKVTMGDNIYHIGVAAFWDCTNLRELYIGEGLEYVQEFAFVNCTGLELVYCASPIKYDQNHRNLSYFIDTSALKVFCWPDSIMDDAWAYDNIHFIYLPMIEAKDATCYEDGNVAYYIGAQGENEMYYDENGEPIAYDDILVEGGHVYGDADWTAATFADCGNDGVLPHFTCRRCGEPIDLEGNVMGTIVDPATGDHDWSVEWTWSADYTATATFTCSVCEAQTSVEADVTYDAETYIYTATAELDGEPYTDTKKKTVTLTFDMGGKCENYAVEVEAGSRVVAVMPNALMAAQAEGYLIHGFTPLTPEAYETPEAYAAAWAAIAFAVVPDTDTVYYAKWDVRITPAFTVGEVKCGTDLAGNAPTVTCDEPEKYYAKSAYWTDEEPGTAVGGTAYEMYLCLDADFGWYFNWEEEPGITGAEVVQEQLNGNQHYFLLNVTAAHYADETSEIRETVLTPATATTDGVKQICVYCAGGCGEIVETRTEAIPATGAPEEPGEPADTDNVCPWCGETHDKRTFIGWWTEFFHDLLYIIRQLFCWWA